MREQRERGALQRLWVFSGEFFDNYHGNIFLLLRMENSAIPNKFRAVAVLQEGYTFVDYLTKGNSRYPVVKAIHEETRTYFAIKMKTHEKVDRNPLDKETEVLTMLSKAENNDHIIRLHDIKVMKDVTFVVMEYANKGDLFKHIAYGRNLTEDETRPFFQQLISGVECCHGNMIAHLDLKPENLLLIENADGIPILKISDFDLSALMENDLLLNKYCGTLRCASPEVLMLKPYSGPPSDVWSCGVILYFVLCGDFPFRGKKNSIISKDIKLGRYKTPENISKEAAHLIDGMLTVDPKARFTIPQIREHPWFQAT